VDTCWLFCVRHGAKKVVVVSSVAAEHSTIGKMHNRGCAVADE
jgi:hypothetical protein